MKCDRAQTINSIIKKGIMDTQQNPNKPGKSTGPGQYNSKIAKGRSVNVSSASVKDKVAVAVHRGGDQAGGR